MSEQYNPGNLPGTVGYEWKAPPGYTGVSQQEQDIAGGLGYGGPSDQYTQGTQGIMDALKQGGGYAAVMPHLGKLAKFMQGGKKMGEAYEKSATKKLQQTGQAAFKGIQSQMGGQGALGSTTHLGGLGDLGQKYGTARAGISADAAQMGESAMMNRLGAGIQGLSSLGQLRSYEQMNEMQGGGQLASLGMQQSGMEHGMNMDQLGALKDQRMEPSQWGYDLWTANQRAPKSGGAGPYIMGAANAAAAGFGLGGVPGSRGGNVNDPSNWGDQGGNGYNWGTPTGGR